MDFGHKQRCTVHVSFNDRQQLLCSTYEDELSLWPGQSCGTVCQRQFVTRTVYTLLNADSSHTFLACVLVIDNVMPFRSGFAHGWH